MLQKFSKELQKIIVQAESIASDLGDSKVRVEHLLLSFMDNKNNLLSQKAERDGVQYEDVLKSVIDTYGKKDEPPFYIEYDETVTEIIRDSILYAKKYHHEKVYMNDFIYCFVKNSVVIKTIFKESFKTETILTELEKSVQKKENKAINKLQNIFNNENIRYATILKPEKEKIILKRDKEIQDVLVALCCKEKPNIALTGHAGVGKTAIVEELARYLEYENSIKRLSNYIIVQLNLTATIAGTRYRGEFEDKIQKYLNAIKDKNVITFVDEGHQLMTVGNSEGSLSISEILKPYLARGEYKFIIATTDEEYKLIISDAAMARRFRHISIQEPEVHNVYDMIHKKVENLSKYHNVAISEYMVKEIINNCDTIPNRYFPDKAIDVIDYTMSYAEVFNNNMLKREDTESYIKQLGGVILHEETKDEIYC